MQAFVRSAITLAAFAAAASSTQAQSSVQLYGLIDVGVGRFDNAEFQRDGEWAKIYKVDRNAMQTSFWGLAGKEDLGSGLSAVFKIEAFFRPDTGEAGRFGSGVDPTFSREAYVGVESTSLGALHLGRKTTQLFVTTLAYNPFGSAFGWSPIIRQVYSGAEGKVRGDSGWSNAVAYYAPKFGGFSLGAIATAGEGDGGTGGTGTVKAYSLGGSYTGGPVSIGLVYQDVQVGATGDVKNKTAMVGVRYDAGFAKFFGQYAFLDDEATDIEDKIMQLGVSVPVGPGNVLASYALDKTESSDDTELATLSVGYQYLLSKRTDVSFVVMQEEQDAGTILRPNSNSTLAYANDQKGTSYGVTLRHRF